MSAVRVPVKACDPPKMAVEVDGHYVVFPSNLSDFPRIDLIVKETNDTVPGYVALVALYGIPAAVPVPPLPIHNFTVRQEPIATVSIAANQGHPVRQDDIHPVADA